MERYQDRPCDLADATLVALGEELGVSQIFSLDADFLIYLLADGRTLLPVPGPRRSGG